MKDRSSQFFRHSRDELAFQVDRMFGWLLAAEWLGIIVAACIISPRTWDGAQSFIHPHLWVALISGPAFILPAIGLALVFPSRQITRHVIAVAQMLVSVVLIDVTGGRIESHFHIFGSLAFLAFYRDWRVLITATSMTAFDHVFQGLWLPETIYGTAAISPWLWVEHAWWVVFEDFFLLLSVRHSTREMWTVAENKAQLYTGAYHDVLTGLANRRMLQESFDSLPSTGVPNKRAVLFIDLDRFKQANDTLGHTVGDKLLTLLASRLAAVVDGKDTLARIGGDEFIVLLEAIHGTDQALALGARILNALATPFQIDEHELLLSASIGISLCPEHGTDLAVLQERADRAMYVAKSQGRNQCAVFSAEVARHEEILKEIGRDLHKALARGEFRLNFQPLVERDARLTGFEALIRWTHPIHGPVPPSDFIPLAEKSGLIVAIGEWVLREACRNCVSWQRNAQRSLGVAVNVSAVQFDEEDFPAIVLGILAEFNMNPSLLTLELTEGALLTNLPRARRQLGGLRKSGVRIALDDFGTGYSSLSYLTSLPADAIKLDHTFVNREFANKPVVIASVIEMAHRVGLRVVGEGVETRLQNDSLLAMECDELQGFYFSPPMPADSVGPYIGNQRGAIAPLSNAAANEECQLIA